MTKPKTVDELIEKRKKAIDKMSPAMREELEWVIAWCQDEQSSSIVRRWELGDKVISIRESHGEKNYKALKLFIPEDPSMLQKVETFARLYSREQAEELANKFMSDGMTKLSYSHIRLLVSIEQVDVRDEATELTLENCWTSTQLGSHIKELLGKRSKGGRKPSVPRDANSIIDQQLSFVNDFENRNVTVWRNPTHSLSAQIAKIEPEQYTEELEQKLGRLAHCMQQLADEANARAAEARRKHESVKRILNMGAVKDITPEDTDEMSEEVNKVTKSAKLQTVSN